MQRKGNAKVILPSDGIFLPCQSEWIKDDSRLKLMVKSRQIGMSWSSAYAADERTAAQGARFDQWVSSRDDLQARLFIEDCKMWAGLMNLAAKDMGEIVINDKDRLTAYVLQFDSGKRIHSMSSNPDAQAGIDPKTGAPAGIDKGWAYAPGASVDASLTQMVADKLITYPEAIATALAADIARYKAGR